MKSNKRWVLKTWVCKDRNIYVARCLFSTILVNEFTVILIKFDSFFIFVYEIYFVTFDRKVLSLCNFNRKFNVPFVYWTKNVLCNWCRLKIKVTYLIFRLRNKQHTEFWTKVTMGSNFSTLQMGAAENKFHGRKWKCDQTLGE